MSDKLRFKVKSSKGCCKTVSTIINESGTPEVVTIDMGSGRITYGPMDQDDEERLRQAKEEADAKD